MTMSSLSSGSYNSTAAYSDESNLHDYVAELQLHMTLHARHLVPGMQTHAASDSRLQLLHKTQADMEKTLSRAWL